MLSSGYFLNVVGEVSPLSLLSCFQPPYRSPYGAYPHSGSCGFIRLTGVILFRYFTSIYKHLFVVQWCSALFLRGMCQMPDYILTHADEHRISCIYLYEKVNCSVTKSTNIDNL